MAKLYIVMVGLPGRGKSTVAARLFQALSEEGVNARIFNNGELRRRHFGAESSLPYFYHPENQDGRNRREQLAVINAENAKAFLRDEGGEVAVLDATNAGSARRRLLESIFNDAPILYLECVNDDPALIEASIERKSRLPEFARLSPAEAAVSFKERISYYEREYSSPRDEGAYVKVDSVHNSILEERMPYKIPYYLRIRDVLVSGWVPEMFLVRHGESFFNVEGRIGGDAPLTPFGKRQAEALADEFDGKDVPYIFTSCRLRSMQTAAPLAQRHPEATIFQLPELDEIDSGVCDSMLYDEIRDNMPEEYGARAKDKYNYIYPWGEGYASMRGRVERGFLKALFLSGSKPGIVVVGHQAVNRTLLSFFLYRRTEDVPYIFVPQDQYFRIIATHRKKLIELIRVTTVIPGSGRSLD